MELTVIAIDIAKKVFQLHWVERDTGSIERLKLKRAQMLPWFANRQPAMVTSSSSTSGGRVGSRRTRA